MGRRDGWRPTEPISSGRSRCRRARRPPVAGAAAGWRCERALAQLEARVGELLLGRARAPRPRAPRAAPCRAAWRRPCAPARARLRRRAGERGVDAMTASRSSRWGSSGSPRASVSGERWRGATPLRYRARRSRRRAGRCRCEPPRHVSRRPAVSWAPTMSTLEPSPTGWPPRPPSASASTSSMSRGSSASSPASRRRAAAHGRGVRDRCGARPAPAEHVAARFAAKEAVLKALGRGWPRDCAGPTSRSSTRRAGARACGLHRAASRLAARRGLTALEISLSHTAALAVAHATALWSALDRTERGEQP